MPARLRGTGITILTGFATVGTVAMAKTSPFFLLLADAEGNPAHDFAMECVAIMSGWLGIANDGAHWRGLYLIGLFPLFLLPFLAVGVRETARYKEIAAGRERTSIVATIRAQFAEARRLIEPHYLPRFRIVVAAVELRVSGHRTRRRVLVHLRPRGSGHDAGEVGNVVMWAYIAGTFGHLLAGQLVDRIGRKHTCAGVLQHRGRRDHRAVSHQHDCSGQYFWHIATVFFFNCAIGATHVYASELFPTELRATGYGWTTNLFGRVTEVAIPYLIGQLIPVMGISWGITWVAIGPITRRAPGDEVRARNARTHARADPGKTRRRRQARRAARRGVALSGSPACVGSHRGFRPG